MSGGYGALQLLLRWSSSSREADFTIVGRFAEQPSAFQGVHLGLSGRQGSRRFQRFLSVQIQVAI
jgi:hypothetical protein